MEIQVQITVTQAGQTTTAIVANLQRDTLTAETLGLTLAEAQQLLVNLQQIIASEQVETYNQQQCACPDCGTSRARKDTKPLTYRTLFGKLELPSPRYYTCDCQPRKRKSESPLARLLPERSSPELLYLQTKWAALMSYGMTAELLTDVLPIEVGSASVRHQVLSVAQRAEDELGPEQVMFIDGSPSQWAELPEPDGRLFVGLDGGYIHAREGNNRKAGWFEAVVGKSVNAQGDGKLFGLVTTYDEKPKRRLYELLQSQGFQLNQNITFLSDGDEALRDLQRYLSPDSEHILDWFHITMRITVMRTMAQRLPPMAESWLTSEKADQRLESAKWYLWHGNVYMALQRLDHLEGDLECFADEDPHWNKLYNQVREFIHYIASNEDHIPNYGERHTYGEMISTAFVESAVNQIVSKRFVKKQQMRWTKRGAHLLLQIRTRVLDDGLRELFRRWYPGMAEVNESDLVAA